MQEIQWILRIEIFISLGDSPEHAISFLPCNIRGKVYICKGIFEWSHWRLVSKPHSYP